MKWLKDYFDLNRKEEAGMITLICLIGLLFALQFVWVYLIPSSKVELAKNEVLADSSKFNHSVSVNNIPDSSKGGAIQLTDFDPNTISEAGLRGLGLSDNVASHIIHYREHGGHFYKPDDFHKIYGLTDEDFGALKPFIIIKSDRPIKTDAPVDLNKADSVQLLSVRGIGPVFASRILAMRGKLGCFVNKDQMLDVYGIDKKHYSFMKDQVYVSKITIRRLNVNTATAEVLQNNPYIRYKMARIIVKYRETNGAFKSLEDLKKIYAIDEKTYQKLRPYLTIN